MLGTNLKPGQVYDCPTDLNGPDGIETIRTALKQAGDFKMAPNIIMCMLGNVRKSLVSSFQLRRSQTCSVGFLTIYVYTCMYMDIIPSSLW